MGITTSTLGTELSAVMKAHKNFTDVFLIDIANCFLSSVTTIWGFKDQPNMMKTPIQNPNSLVLNDENSAKISDKSLENVEILNLKSVNDWDREGYVYIYLYTYIFIDVYLNICISYTYMFIFMYLYFYAYVYKQIYINIYIYIYINMYIHLYII
jgi:hypothetical protein